MLEAHSFLLAALVVGLVAAWLDYRTGHIPNWLTLGPLAVAPLAHGVVGYVVYGWDAAVHGASFSLLGALACGLVPYLLYRMGGIFAGDVKLLAAIGALCHPVIGIEAEFYAFIAAALYAPARMAYEGKLWRTLGNTAALAANPFLPKAKRRTIAPEMLTELRFGPAVAVGVALAVALEWRVA